MRNGLRKRNPFCFRRITPIQAPNLLLWVHWGALGCTGAQNQNKSQIPWRLFDPIRFRSIVFEETK
jgi:hypothetical protein